MKGRGALVDWLPDRPFYGSLSKAVTRISTAFVYPFTDVLYRKILESFSAGHYDIIFIINGQTLSPFFLRYLKQCFPSARFVLYMWDSFKNRPGWKRCLDSFDSVLTFDSKDSFEYGIALRPLFYGRGFTVSPPASHEIYRLSFIGTAHSDRYDVIKRLQASLPPDLPVFWYLYLQSRFCFVVLSLF